MHDVNELEKINKKMQYSGTEGTIDRGKYIQLKASLGRFVKRCFPPNSKRRVYFTIGHWYGKILIENGFTAFLFALKEHVKAYKEMRRVERADTPISQPDDIICISPSEYVPLTNIRIAVHVHVYYIDLFDEIILHLNNVPIQFSLFVSVTNDEHRQTVLQKIHDISHVDRAEVRIVENRGRNIAPFLAEFGRSFHNYDYICHIHTKKSIYTGEERTGWRRYLYERLLGSPDIIHAILTAFERDPKIGIICPEIYPYLPYWACTWLSNKGIAAMILQRLNIPFDPDEYFDYPVGSMFWIRKQALDPIIGLGLTERDFPVELGQTDGTLHHTIERCFILAARSRGYRHLVIRDPETHVFSYRSGRNLHQYLDMSFQKRFMRGLEVSEIVSFDIFDTLLIRPFASPDRVFDYLEEKIQGKFGIRRFKELRINAELIARERKNHSGDVKISEIYSVFVEIAKIDPEVANEVLNLEVNTEKRLFIPRKELIESAKYAKKMGKRVILISDTYFERTHVEDILAFKNLDFFDKIYLSCETGKRKDRGDLWDHIIEKEGIYPSNFMHVGDNEESDIQRIHDRGFHNVIHVMRPSVLFRQSKLGDSLWNRISPSSGWRENVLYGKIANRLSSNPDKKHLFNSPTLFEDPYITGYVVFGPIFFNFMNWLINNARKDKCQTLWFIAREGYLLNSLYHTIIRHPDLHEIRAELPHNSYFLCSRRTAIFASFRGDEDIPQLMDGLFTGTLRDFFAKRLLTNTINRIEDRLGTEILDRQVSLVKDRYVISNAIREVTDILAAEATRERELLLKYCRNQGYDPTKRISVVDLGYSGTIQYALSALLNHPIEGYYFVTQKGAKKLSSAGLNYRAYFGQNVDLSPRKCPIFHYSLLLEAVLTAPTGQLIRFDTDTAGDPVPVFKEGGISQREFHRIGRIHEGIIAFIREMLDEFGKAALEIEFPIDLVQVCYGYVISGDIDIGSLESILSVEDQYSGYDEISPLEYYRKYVLNNPEYIQESI